MVASRREKFIHLGAFLSFFHVVIKYFLNDGTVWSWGSFPLGDGTTNNSSIPIQVSGLTDITMIAAGWSHSLALAFDGTVWSWGVNSDGQLGNRPNTNNYIPVQVR